jgi:phage FluMu gp28-like protein
MKLIQNKKVKVAKEYMSMLTKLQERKHKLTDFEIEQISHPGHWLHLCQYKEAPVVLDDYQVTTINATGRYIIVVKPRQVGFSTFGVSGKAVAKSHLRPGHKSVICSYNLSEAKEKIVLAKEINDGIPARLQKRVVSDTAFGMKFADGGSIISTFSPRGHSNCDIYLDEYAHVADQIALYNASFPIIRRQPDKQLVIGSTPLGKLGQYHAIFIPEGDKFKAYDRHVWFWWDSPYYCKDIPGARYGNKKYGPAHTMPTELRVQVFGDDAIKEIFDNMLIEDFQQEYESYFCDEALSFFPYELISSRMKWFKFDEQGKFPKKLHEIGSLQQGRLFAGYDVGRKLNTAELMVFDYRSTEEGYAKPKFIQVFQKTFNDQSFRIQREYLKKFLNMYSSSIQGFCIDRLGIGMDLSEHLEENYPNVCTGITLTSAMKAQIAWTCKNYFQDGIIEIWPDRETRMQIHSIKQIHSEGSRIPRYDTDKNERNHHADRFWALALACHSVKTDS